MRAMAIVRCGALEEAALEAVEIDKPEPAAGQILLKVLACGVCHTELDQIEGRLRPGRLPVVPGHQIVGEVVEAGSGADRFAVGQRVGVTWLRSACMQCRYCDSGRENLCDAAQWTGHDADGGYAEMTTEDERFAYAIPEAFDDAEAAPLLCAGVIGYRALRLAGIEEGHVVGLFGFGASAHIVIQVVRHLYPNNAVFVFTRGARHREHAKQLGAAWVGGPEDRPPATLDRAIDFTPVGETIKRALEVSAKGARLVVNAIRKRTPIPEMEYARHLWHEREITSVANVTAADAEEFLPLAGRIPIRPKVTVYPLAEANEALKELKAGGIDGAAVLKP